MERALDGDPVAYRLLLTEAAVLVRCWMHRQGERGRRPAHRGQSPRDALAEAPLRGALVAFQPHPVVFGSALFANGLGFRHAGDADHNVAIDNMTRKLMLDGKRPVTVSHFFSHGYRRLLRHCNCTGR